MSRTANRTRILCRAGLAAGVALLAACGGGESANRPAATAASSAGQPPAASSDDSFCTRAAGIDERVDSALSDLGEDDASVPQAFSQIAVELRAIEAPDEITTAWEAMAAGLDRMADAFADVDLTDPGSLSRLDDAEGNLTEASTDVEDFLRDRCGIDPS